KVDGFIDFSKQVILGNKVFYVDCFGLKFPGWVRPEHIKTFLRNCFIPNSTKKAVDPSLSTASGCRKAAPFCLAKSIFSPRRSDQKSIRSEPRWALPGRKNGPCGDPGGQGAVHPTGFGRRTEAVPSNGRTQRSPWTSDCRSGG